MGNAKPFVAVAAFCDRVLIEQDGVMSAIRIVDTFNVALPPGAPPDAIPVIAVAGLLALKSGDVVGEHIVDLVLENTRGERATISPKGGYPVEFKGGEHGVQIRLDFTFAVKNFGLVWFDVMFDNETLTRMPLRLKRADTPTTEEALQPQTS